MPRCISYQKLRYRRWIKTFKQRTMATYRLPIEIEYALLNRPLVDFRKNLLRYPWQLITIGGSICVFFRFFSDVPKASALWTTLSFWSLNISLAVTAWADDQAIILRVKNLLAHFSPRAEILFSSFPVSEHTSRHPPSIGADRSK